MNGIDKMKPSERFKEITGRTGLYNIQAIDNIPSIMRYGLLSNERASKIGHISIANNEVQSRRDKVIISYGFKLHQYANLYFDSWNPMLSNKRNQNEDICILKFNRVVLDFKGVILSDRNASSRYVTFYNAQTGLEKIDFNLVYMQNWKDIDRLEEMRKKSIKCAEILVPDCIPFKYVMCAAVVNENAKNRLQATGFNKRIYVEPNAFFGGW
jgi:hypothetical protein